MAKSSGNRSGGNQRGGKGGSRGIANLPGKTGNPSGRGRGNALPKGGKSK